MKVGCVVEDNSDKLLTFLCDRGGMEFIIEESLDFVLVSNRIAPNFYMVIFNPQD